MQIKKSNRRQLERSKLHEVVHKLLVHRNGKTLIEIQAATEVKQAWLSAFLQNRINEPSAIRLEKLYTYLTGKPLKF